VSWGLRKSKRKQAPTQEAILSSKVGRNKKKKTKQNKKGSRFETLKSHANGHVEQERKKKFSETWRYTLHTHTHTHKPRE
jgi:hypothetical protein